MQEVFPRREVGLKVKELKLVFQIEVSKLHLNVMFTIDGKDLTFQQTSTYTLSPYLSQGYLFGFTVTT